MALARKGTRHIVVDGTTYRLAHEAKPVLPSDITHAIERALREGWTPTAPGSPFHLNLSTGFTRSP